MAIMALLREHVEACDSAVYERDAAAAAEYLGLAVPQCTESEATDQVRHA